MEIDFIWLQFILSIKIIIQLEKKLYFTENYLWVNVISFFSTEYY